jgi:hypothetical protein
MKTQVVNVKASEFDIYIGRAATRASDPRCHEESPFANPFMIGRDGDRAQVIQKYREHLLACVEQDPATWIPRLRALKGKRLGCWCKRAPGPSWPPFGMLDDGTAEFQILAFTQHPLADVAGAGAPYHVVLRIPFRGVPSVDGATVKLPWRPVYGQLHLASAIEAAPLLGLPALFQKLSGDIAAIKQPMALLVAQFESSNKFQAELRERLCLSGPQSTTMLTKTPAATQPGYTLKLEPAAADHAKAFSFGQHLQLELVGLRLHLSAAQAEHFRHAISPPVAPFLNQILHALTGPRASVVFLDRRSCSHVGMLPQHVLDYKDTACHGDVVAEFADYQVES